MTAQPSEASLGFDALLAPHLAHLLAFARRLTGNADEAEDLVQETVIRAWRHLEQLHQPGAARAWLFRILRTVAIEAARTRARRQDLAEVVELDGWHEQVVANDGPDPLELLLAAASAHAVEAALQALPADFAHAVALHDLHELKYREIAEVLEVPLGTVMSRICRGRRILAAILRRDRAAASSERRPIP